MSQAAVKSLNGRSAAWSGDRIAALHRQGVTWRLVVLESSGAGGRVVEARSIPVTNPAEVRSVLAHHGVSRLIRVLPASSAVCRVVEVPEGDAASVASALELIGEASLPQHLPAHRRAAAPLAGINGHVSPRAALVVGWSGASDETPIGGVNETWTAEPAALLWLMRMRCRAAVYADRSTGSMCAFAAGPQRLVVRALRENAEAGESWERAIEECFRQTTAGAGLAARSMRLGAGDVELRVETRDSPLFEGLMPQGASEGWAAEHGVAAAAALGALVGPLSIRPLFSLTAEPVRVDEARVVRWLRWMSLGANAQQVIAASLAAALFGPLAIAAARHAILDAKSGGLAAQQESDRREALTDSFHDELGKRRWPMTRLLAQLSGALPVGVRAESLRLEAGQRVSVQGSADSLELVNRLQSVLNGTGVFAEATIDRTQGGEEGGVEFDLSARVVRPYAEAKGIEDFAKQTLSQRLYGGEYAESSVAPAASRSERADGAEEAPPRGPVRERSTRPAAKPAEIPEPISDEEIAKLDASAAMKQWTSRQKASKQSGIDAATRDRLKDEAEKCRARMQAARKESSP